MDSTLFVPILISVLQANGPAPLEPHQAEKIYACPTFTIPVDGCTIVESDIGGVPDKLENWFFDIVNEIAEEYTDECNTHDRNYWTLGKTRHSSDQQLKADFREEATESWFEKLGPEWKLVEQAWKVMAGVRDEDYYIPRQQDAYTRYTNIGKKVKANQCFQHAADLPIDTALLNVAKATFRSITSREPTAYEEFDMVELYNPTHGGDLSSFRIAVDAYATSKINVSGPEALVVVNKVEGIDQSSITLSVPQYSADGQKLETYVRAFGQDSRDGSLTLSFSYKYDQALTISGWAVVTDENGNSDFKKIEEKLNVKGWCSPREGIDCY
ncbi:MULTISPECIES: hypothetical protein [Pseudoalteromonas]|uniref:Uncharacterized protein n=1 Tax=Pseudoalteromonas luteoviolacea (strain 2ta16) TaxID=1353533 RepID=V4HZ72_PSEL2|nr:MULTISPECIES: hypothetical protein [Pseudoalteromonas]ESP93249.1 hypothetical protein PL2TA16_03470 [Pseudoalteromonas luteoviolacea 2ta16]KZN36632.1 hypothetical protein N483_22190 [Pseudoalteromonas luteoviolacea NCIMB 1944]MCG7550390.1 hypothetical protein [Pseudoalteromonas sp. Of7M-16]